MTTSVIFCLSYDLLKELFNAYKVDIIATKCIVDTDIVMIFLVPARSDNTRYMCGHNIIYDMMLSAE